MEKFYLDHKERWIDEKGHEMHKTLDEARPEIIHELNQERVLSRMDDLISSILESPEAEPFAQIAERLGIPSGTIEFNADQPKAEPLGLLQDLKEALENQKDLAEGARINRPIVCGTGEGAGHDRCILRLLSRQPAHAPALAEVREKILADLKSQKSLQMAETLLKRLQAAASQDEKGAKIGLEKAAADLKIPGLKTGVSDPFRSPDRAALPKPLDHQASVARAAFELQKTGDLTDPGFSEDAAEGAVFQLMERLPPDASGFQAQRATLSKQIRENIADQFLRGWLSSVANRTWINKRLEGTIRPPATPAHIPEAPDPGGL